MTVRDLIIKLQEQDQDLPVYARKITRHGIRKEYKPVASVVRSSRAGFYFVGIDAQIPIVK